MKITQIFGEISSKDVVIAGGKGASLGEMTRAGIPVPPGFVILSTVFEEFIEKTDLNVEIDSILDGVNHEEMHTVENASEKIQALILGADTPNNIIDEIEDSFKKLGTAYVAVRSSATAEDSATAAWAGQLDSFLNTTDKTLLENVKKCWASLFTPRAIFYRFEKKLHTQKISVAVVVQKMVESEVSGIAFSVHPVTQDRNQLIIEAGLGLGEAIVSGSITPDSYVVEKTPRRIIDKNISSQERGLYRVPGGGNEWKDISKEQGERQALNDVQIEELSEIILGIEKHYGFPVDVEWAFEKGKFYIVQSRPITTLAPTGGGGNAPDGDGKYILANQDIDASFLTLGTTWRGLRDAAILQQVGMLTPDSFVEIIKGTTLNYYLLKDGAEPFISLCAKLIIEDRDLLPKLKKETVRVAAEMQKLAYDAKDNIEKLSDKELGALLNKIINVQVECVVYGTVVAFSDIFGGITNRLLEIVQAKDGLARPVHVYTSVLGQPVENSLSEKAYIDIRLSNKSDGTLLDQYFWLDQGYIGRGLTQKELEKIQSSGKEKETTDRKRLEQELKLTLEESRLFGISQDIIFTKALRVDSRQFLNVISSRIVDRLSKRWKVKPELLEALTIEELIDAVNGNIEILTSLPGRFNHSVIVPKGDRYEYLFDLEAAEFLQKHLYKEEIQDKTTIRGNVAQHGKAKGMVKLVFGPQHNNKVQEGDILVSPATSPQLLPAMHRAAAFVTDVGGITSHAAIVARELKKPCIVGTKHATQVLNDGDMVEVDADAGVVRILKKR